MFDIHKIVSLRPNAMYVQHYYRINQFAYSLFHTSTDRMYMGISRDGIYKPDDLLEAAKVVERYLRKRHATQILELATGRGATSAYLAEKFPQVRMDGIDISAGQLEFAYKKARHLTNYHPIFGDYHDLSAFKTATFDIVFVIEALCYSREKQRVLREVKRVLKPGGVFIVFDGYGKSASNLLGEIELLASQLTEKSLAVSEFEEYNSFLMKAKQQGYKVVEEEDVSPYILPTLRRFERLAKIFFAVPLLAKVTAKLLPPVFIYNIVAGYLFPEIITSGIGCYYITVLRK